MTAHQVTLWASGLVTTDPGDDVAVVIAECSCGQWRAEFPEPAPEAEVHTAAQAHLGDHQ